MPVSHRARFGVPVMHVAAGYYPFELQIWCFTGHMEAGNSGEWIVNFQVYARKMGGSNSPVPNGNNGYINDFESACLYKTNDHTVTANATTLHELALHAQPHDLPLDFHINTLDTSGNVQVVDTLRYKVVPSAAGDSEPPAISLVDVEVNSTLKLLGTTEVVVVDPIF